MKLGRGPFTGMEFIQRLLWIAIACVALPALAGCDAFSKAPTPSPTVPPTHTPTRRPTRTAAPPPTATSSPTARPLPTATSTWSPTATPTITPTPAPVCVGQTTAALRLRAGPSTEHAHLGSLQEGDTVGILSRTSDGEWYRISLEDGAIHWVAAAYVDAENDIESIPTVRPESLTDLSTPTPTDAPTGPKVDVATANVNLRAGPGTDYPIVGGLKEGDAVEIAGKTGDGGWYQVWRPDRSFAWVSAAYVQVNTDAGAIDVVPASQIPPTPSPAPTVPPTAPPPPAVRPPTGMLEDYAPGGKGKLLIKNGTDADALVILTGLDDQAVKSAYIRNAESFDMTGIHDGTYRLYYSKGQAFNTETKRFALNATYQRLDATIEFTTTSSQYTAWEVTLYGVSGGNVGSESVDPSKFP